MTAGHHTHPHKSALVAILLTCIGYACFNITDACVKALGHHFHFSQIIAMNALVIILLVGTHGWLRDGGKRAFTLYRPKWVLLRALFATLSIVVNVISMPHITLTTFYTLVFTSPLWVTLLATVFMKEKLEMRRAVVIFIGFSVIVYIFRPGSDLFSFWTMMTLLNAFFYSCSMMVMRYLGPQASRTSLITTSSLMNIVFVLPFLFTHFVTPTLGEWGLFILMGTASSGAMMALTYAFQNAPSASMIAPYHYTQIVWGALIGYFIFNEIPDTRTLLGAAVLIAGGLYLIHSETRRKKGS